MGIITIHNHNGTSTIHLVAKKTKQKMSNREYNKNSHA